jgi:hypothetical protein
MLESCEPEITSRSRSRNCTYYDEGIQPATAPASTIRFLLIGLAAGWLASQLVEGRGFGLDDFMKRLVVSGLLAIAIISWPQAARAQYGYPSGYGGYGWGGWGSTPQGNIARGLGYFNMGRGVYNEDTAVARSINTDTVMRWNQYTYLSNREAATRYGARLQAEHARVDRARARIQDRLRNHPGDRDITDSDALNVLVDELESPAVLGSSLSTIKTPIDPRLIQEIPFKVASEGMTICLDQMTMNEQWPVALRVDAFRPEREALRKAVLKALAEDKNGDLEPKTIEAVQAAIDRFRVKFQELVPPSSPDYVPAHDTIKAMAGLTKMLYSPQVEEILAELEKYRGTTLGELLSFMRAFNLRFAKANSFRQRRIYLMLYPLLAQQADAAQGAGVAAEPGEKPGADAAKAVGAVDGAGRNTIDTAENLGNKAVEGLKSAATDFFRDMDWKHLSGSPKPAQKTGQ